jgi:Secretion system C-terminal sorting domain
MICNRFFIALLACMAATPLLAQHTNITITNTGTPDEPSIYFNPKEPKYVVAGSNLNKVFYSSDTGRTWTTNTLTSTYGVWGDPVIVCDTTGAFYYFHLSNPPAGTGSFLDRIVCQKSTNNGQSWSTGTFMGLNGAKDQDKEWAIVDPATNAIHVLWSQFDVYGSSNPADSTHIMYARSADGGNTWTTAVRINQKGGDCQDLDNTVEGAVPAIGPNGQLYTAWAGPEGIVFDKSLDGGNTWMATDKIVTTIPGGWDFAIPGVDRCNGLPVTVCDRSNSAYRGHIYINWADQRNGVSNTDIWVIKSTDGGNTWGSPIRVNDDASNRQQFLSWMTVDQTNGYLYVVFYDRRNYTDNQTDVYVARSVDGGATWTNFKVSASPFTPAPNVFFGDYSNIFAHNNIVRPIWARQDAGNKSIVTALVNTSILGPTGVNEPADENGLAQNYPNPFNKETFVSFKIRSRSVVSVEIYDQLGRLVYQPITGQVYNYGKYVERISFAERALPPGVYYLQLKVNNTVSKRKMLRVE